MSSFHSMVDVMSTANLGMSTFSDSDFENAFVNTLKFRKLKASESNLIATNVGPVQDMAG